MSGNTHDKNKIIRPYLCHMICVLLMLLMAGCGDPSTGPASTDNTTADASRTGSATFSVQWQTNNTTSAAAADTPARYAIEDCSALGIESITCVVYNNSNNPVANGGPWKCTDGSANMAVVPAGSNLTFTILGWDTDLEQDGAEGNIIYQGSTTVPVTIVPGETTNAGEIIANPFVPTALEANAVSTSQIELAWHDQGAASYRIYQDGDIVATPTSPSFTVIDLTQNTRYCYMVSAVDIYANESGQSLEQCATTGADNDTEAPTVPTSVNAAAVSESQIDITWVESTDNVGVTGYRVYRNGEEVGVSTTTSFSDANLQPNTRYCYRVAAYDAADNVSQQSSEVVCSTTLSLYVWYRDFDQDEFGDPAVSITATTPPTGYVENNTDCDDSIATIHPGAREVCNDRDDNCNKLIDENCTANLSASFTTRLIVNDGVLVGDAKDQEGQPFNSNTLFVDGPNSDRVSLEFDIRYPIGGGTATLQFEMENTSAPDAYFYGDLYSYRANGLVNGRDHFDTQFHQQLEFFYDNGQTGIHTYSFDITKAFLEFNASEQQYMGISIRAVDTNARCQITNPILTVTQD